jgi:hypothetical protein
MIGYLPVCFFGKHAPMWCNMMHVFSHLLEFTAMANRRVQSYTAPAERTIRASVSFPEDQYAELERIALDQRVSLAWVVREAVQSYLVTRWPLLEGEDAKVNEQTTGQT